MDQTRTAVDAAVALVEVVEVAVDGVAAGDGVVEIAVLDHHLGLDEAGLGPLEGGELVTGGVVAGADAALGAPMLEVAQPELMGVWSARGGVRSFPGIVQVDALGGGDLLSLGGILRVLRGGGEDEGGGKDCEANDAMYGAVLLRMKCGQRIVKPGGGYARLARNASTSAREGMEACAPRRVTE